jgi:TPR repeat protein
MKKLFSFKLLLFWTLFLFGYSQLYAFDEKRDKEAKTVELKLYLEEQGVENSEEKTWNMLQKAAREGDAAALHKIGTMYELGIYVDKDYPWAMLWYLRSAVRGYADAQSDVGILYEDGLGGYRDVTAALFWYEKAAVQGHPFAVEAVQRLKKEVLTHKTESVI